MATMTALDQIKLIITTECTTMEANEKISLFNEVTTEESATVTGGANVNFDLDSYLFRVGAGAIFDGGLTTNVINLAFQGAIFTSTGSGTPATTPRAVVGIVSFG